MAASWGDEPRSMCLVIFSSTTMESSTTIPMATVKAESEMMLSELSVSSRYTKATINAIGIVMPMISVARHFPRKKKTTSTTKRRA